ncbi:MAG: hypothetical protein V3U76_12330 [Granulosicoccus sp.]
MINRQGERSEHPDNDFNNENRHNVLWKNTCEAYPLGRVTPKSVEKVAHEG